jgi:5-methylcytosine-specific restriction protein A
MPLRRSSPLRAKAPLKRRSPLRTKAEKTSRPKNTGPDRATRDLVFERDGGCVVCGCGPYGLQVHHRKPRRMGGRSVPEINAPSNLISLCAADHGWVESRRAEALELGLLVAEHDDPRDVPLNHCLYGPVLLDHDGGWLPA